MVKIIGEIGINHNGSVELCKRLMMISKGAGMDYVKLQKRDPDVCVPEAQKSKRRMTPWGEMSYLEYKKRVEFNEEQIKELLLEFICRQFLVDPEDIEIDKSLIDTGIIDSMGLIGILSFIEQNFNFKVKEDQMNRQNFGSVLLIVDFIDRNNI